MGVVYLAQDTKLDRHVAIKSMPPELQTSSTAQTRFMREARLLASLSHPGIGVIHDIIEQAEGNAYLVLEYVPGETLTERMAREPLQLKDALSIGLRQYLPLTKRESSIETSNQATSKSRRMAELRCWTSVLPRPSSAKTLLSSQPLRKRGV